MKADRLLVLLCGLMIAITSSGFAETPPGHPVRGQNLYQQHCLRCHGAKLDGNGPDAASLRVQPTNLHTYLMLARGAQELEAAIRQGRNLTPMHAWDAALTDEQVYDLVAYIRSAVPRIEVKP
jgi:mono/diheme cytochrome c family protein